MSLYDRRRSAGAKLLAEMPATIVAIPPPSHRVKPRTCTSSQNPRIEGPCDLLTVHDFRYRLPAGISGFEFMPMLDPVFPGLPAPEDISPLELAVEIDQSLIEPLEHAADLRELEGDRKSTRLNSSHLVISYAVFCLKKKKKQIRPNSHTT